VPKEKLLEFEPKDGWKPLCKFLGKDVPAGSCPRVNDAQAAVKPMRRVSAMVLGIMTARATVIVGAASAVIIGLGRHRPSLLRPMLEAVSATWIG
jgi:hypothetical protein